MTRKVCPGCGETKARPTDKVCRDCRRKLESYDNDLPAAMVIGRLKSDLVAARERIAELEAVLAATEPKETK
jgi:hypothetical protein